MEWYYFTIFLRVPSVEQIGDTLQAFVTTLAKDCPKKKRGIIPTESVVVALVAVEAMLVPITSAADL